VGATPKSDVTPLLDDGDAPEFPDYDVVDSVELDAAETPRVKTGAAIAELLSKPSEPVDASDIGTVELNGLVAHLQKLVEDERGYGLSAVQIGFPARVFVLGLNAGGGVFINPEIVSHGRDVETALEGCLSLRSIYRPIRRWRVITAAWTAIDGRRHKARLSGIAARAFQHELDHLNGILIVDEAAGVPSEDV
jgi:peptide deformylase